MPVTPFHFGLGLAAKAAVMRRFSLGLFVALQVVTDLESLYNLVYERYPVHRFLHTFVGATLLGAAGGAVAWMGLRAWRRARGRPAGARDLATLMATGLFSTWSHVVLDGIMHRDMHPLRPFGEGNPLLGLVGLGTLHGGLVLLGVFGLAGIGLAMDDRSGDP